MKVSAIRRLRAASRQTGLSMSEIVEHFINGYCDTLGVPKIDNSEAIRLERVRKLQMQKFRAVEAFGGEVLPDKPRQEKLVEDEIHVGPEPGTEPAPVVHRPDEWDQSHYAEAYDRAMRLAQEAFG